jgi:hypothetical protein
MEARTELMAEPGSFQLAPLLHLRSPATGGVVDDPRKMDVFRTSLMNPTGVSSPAVIVLNLEGRYLTISALYNLIVPLGQAVRAGLHGDVSLIFATPDPATREGIRALAEAYQLPLYVAPSVNDLSEAEPVGQLTAGEHDTIEQMRRLGGRVTVAQLSEASGLDQPAAANRLNAVVGKKFAYRVDRPRTEGHLYIAPWVAQPEDPADPTSGDFHIPEALRADVRALAEAQGKAPDEVFSEALQAFLSKHQELLKDEQKTVAQMMDAGDQEGLTAYTKRYSKKKASVQARRAKKH